MISELTHSPNESAEAFTFTPMSEEQMANTKGGTDYPDWLQELIDIFDELVEYINGIPDIDEMMEEDFWDSHGDYIESLGVDPLEP